MAKLIQNSYSYYYQEDPEFEGERFNGYVARPGPFNTWNDTVRIREHTTPNENGFVGTDLGGGSIWYNTRLVPVPFGEGAYTVLDFTEETPPYASEGVTSLYHKLFYGDVPYNLLLNVDRVDFKDIELLDCSAFNWTGNLIHALNTPIEFSQPVGHSTYSSYIAFYNGWIVEWPGHALGFLGVVGTGGYANTYRVSRDTVGRLNNINTSFSIGSEYIINSDYGAVSVPSDVYEIFTTGEIVNEEWDNSERYRDSIGQRFIYEGRGSSHGGGAWGRNGLTCAFDPLTRDRVIYYYQGVANPTSVALDWGILQWGLNIPMGVDETNPVFGIWGHPAYIDITPLMNIDMRVTNKLSGRKYKRMKGAIILPGGNMNHDITSYGIYNDATINYLGYSQRAVKNNLTSGWKVGSI